MIFNSFYGQESRKDLARLFCLDFSVKMLAGPWSLKGMTRVGSCTSTVARSQALGGRPPRSFNIGLCLGSLLHGGWFPSEQATKREQGGNSNVLCDLTSEVTHLYICFILLILIQYGKGIIQIHEY